MRGRALVVLAALALAGALIGLVVLLRGASKPSRSRASGAAAADRSTGDEPAATAPATSEPSASAPAAAPAPPPGAAPAHVDGLVVDDATQTPVANVDVVFTGAAGDATATSAADGRFAIDLAPGTLAVRATGPGVIALPLEKLRLAAGARVADYRVRVVELARVAGRVVDQEGRPVDGATVTFLTDTDRGSLSTHDLDADGVARTGADGAFALAVAPGEVTLVAGASGASGHLRLPFVAPGAQLGGAEIVISAGATVAGVVVDTSGAPVAGAQVGLQGRASGRRLATSGADGRFTFEHVPDDTFMAEARASGSAASVPAGVAVTGGAVTPAELTLRLRPARALRGRVVDGDGHPVAGARVQAYRLSALEPPVASTGADGAFTLDDLDPGPWGLVARKPGLAAGRVNGVTAPKDGVEIRLAALGGLAGVVTDEHGKPVPDFTVRVESARLATGVQGDPGADAHVAAADGSFRLDALEAGRYQLVVVATGHGPARRVVDVPAGGVADASVTLPAGTSIEGRVLDAQSGDAVAGARVTTGAGADARVTTGADGRFAIDDVAPGRHSVSVEAPGYVGRTESGVTTSAGQRASLDIRLTPLDPAAAAKGAHPVEFAGIGAVITGQGDALVVMELIPGGPAETAGVVRGDVVLAVDGQPVAGRTLPDVIEDIRGVVGTYVRLSLRRGDRELTLDIVRGTVRVGG